MMLTFSSLSAPNKEYIDLQPVTVQSAAGYAVALQGYEVHGT